MKCEWANICATKLLEIPIAVLAFSIQETLTKSQTSTPIIPYPYKPFSLPHYIDKTLLGKRLVIDIRLYTGYV